MKRYVYSQRDLGNNCPCCDNTHDPAYSKRGRACARRSDKQEIEDGLGDWTHNQTEEWRDGDLPTKGILDEAEGGVGSTGDG